MNETNDYERPEWQTRVIIEKADLDDRLEKLVQFKATPIHDNLNVEEQRRLNAQFFVMMAYSQILEARIENFAAEVRP